MALNIKNPRFIVREDEQNPSYAWWSLQFDGREFVAGTHPAPRDDVYEFLEWLKGHAREIDITPAREQRARGE